MRLKSLATVIGAFVLVFASNAFSTSRVVAAGVTINDARVIAYLCSAGVSTQIQGEVDAAIARLLGAIDAEGQATIDVADLTGVLDQFSDDTEKKEVYQSFTDCVVRITNGIKDTRPEALVVGTREGGRILVPDPIMTVNCGQRFATTVNETRLVTDEYELLMTTQETNRANRVYVRIIGNSGTYTESMELGEKLDVREIKCRLELYSIDEKQKMFSFRLVSY